jgi:hypothetical protein
VCSRLLGLAFGRRAQASPIWSWYDSLGLDLLMIQIDGNHVEEEVILVAAISVQRGATSVRSASSTARPHGFDDLTVLNAKSGQ